ncbi:MULTISPECIES: MFS transporter [unclassified Streptomyces]|uniref:MFS transporter n=1 Tax=Streptomyces sp. NBC_00060 TaxID=2975636 RepID=A0AAU2GSJ9_9ACTN
MPRTVWLLVAARAINRLGAFSLPFLTVLISADFGASTTTAGLLSAAFGLATIPSRLAGGHLAARLGRRRTIVVGLTGCALAQLGIAAAGSLVAVACFAILLGLAFELYEPPSQAIIADTVPPAERVRAYGLLNAALAAGGTGAGLIAAALGRYDLRWLFVVDALTCLACALALRIALPADHPHPPAADQLPPPATDHPHPPAAHDRELGAPVRPWRDRALWAMFTSGTAFALISMQIVMALPLTLDRRGHEAADAGLLFTASAVTVIAAQPALRLRRLTVLAAPVALALGYTLLAIGLAGYAIAHTLPAFLIATAVWSLGDVIILGRAISVVADLAPAGATDRYLAAYGISWGIATTAAPVTATQILEHTGVTTLWAATACLALALAAAQLLIVKPLIIGKPLISQTGPPRPTGDTTTPVTQARRHPSRRR